MTGEQMRDWLNILTQPDYVEIQRQALETEAKMDDLEFQTHGQNSRHMPLWMAQAVDRIIYAVSTVQNTDLPDETAPIFAAMSWQADHDTKMVTLTGEEIDHYSTLIEATVQQTLGTRNRFLQRFLIRKFLRQHPPLPEPTPPRGPR